MRATPEAGVFMVPFRDLIRRTILARVDRAVLRPVRAMEFLPQPNDYALWKCRSRFTFCECDTNADIDCGDAAGPGHPPGRCWLTFRQYWHCGSYT